MTLSQELRGWTETDGMSDDGRRKLWLMRQAADQLDQLRQQLLELADAVAAEVDAKPGFGGSGFLLARLADARHLLQNTK
jgi:hypothetical protein